MQKCYKLLLTLNLIVALSQSQTRTECIKITEGFPLAHSSLCFKSSGQAWGRTGCLSGSLFRRFLFGFGLALNLPGCWEHCTKQDKGGLHGQSFIHGMSCWWHTLTQMVKSLLGDKQSKRKGEWNSENSPQWPARKKNNLLVDGFCLRSY